MYLKSVLSFASFAALAVGASIDDLLRDLQDIQSEVIDLDTAINAFPNVPTAADLVSAVNIHSTALSAGTMMNITTADIQTITAPVSETEGTQIVNAINSLKSPVDTVLTSIVNKKCAFTLFTGLIPGIPALNPVRVDFVQLNSSASALGDALISLVPTDLHDAVPATRTEILNNFAVAIAAFT
ncbi:hypothetical protein NP233_g6265 [Leucocoprinus birnbaumii]|uniref:Hydrophobic surface binding protein n=1 Tax=Leucocoprinus birnbaumii TaxID=56174 RepID=A0AAD5YR34_9AGAR|nr:hypothetical protein NP233_g6265 [Leucocoprinus birnbaumii]